ncbi:MAG: DNA repair protein RadC [Candidatus Omnitrophica bacterium]|nr:DNA repair protein RadC [Candidatus Omnitrophota bacterium]
MGASNGIRSWPKADRPREKLLRLGEHRLTDSELLAILIQSGARGSSAIELARRILTQLGPWGELSHVPLKEWRSIKGLGPAKIAQIKAAIEIGRRLQEQPLEDIRVPIDSSKDIVRLLAGRMRDLKREIVKVVYLNSQNKVITMIDAEEGTVNCAHPILREVFSAALYCSASALICVHNHPSGDPAPSPEDRQFTRELCQAGAVLGIAVLDHIIIGNSGYYSFTDEGDEGSKIN